MNYGCPSSTITNNILSFTNTETDAQRTGPVQPDGSRPMLDGGGVRLFGGFFMSPFTHTAGNCPTTSVLREVDRNVFCEEEQTSRDRFAAARSSRAIATCAHNLCSFCLTDRGLAVAACVTADNPVLGAAGTAARELFGSIGVPTMTFNQWQQGAAKLTGIAPDAHSVVADPQFVDAPSCDFRLKPTSPALKLGFEQIPPIVAPQTRRST